MNDTIPLRTRPMKPEEIFGRFRSWVGPIDAALVRPDKTIRDLADLLTDDLTFWTARSEVRELGRLIEEAFDIHIDDWETDWLPPNPRSLAELCDRIAAEAKVVVPDPVTILGQPCLS